MLYVLRSIAKLCAIQKDAGEKKAEIKFVKYPAWYLKHERFLGVDATNRRVGKPRDIQTTLLYTLMRA